MTNLDLSKLSLDDVMRLGAEHVVVALSLTVYIKEPLTPHAQAIGRLVEAYLEHAEPHLTWCADWVTDRFKKADSELLRVPIKLLAEHKNHKVNPTWIYLGGAHHRDLSPWYFWARSQLKYRANTLSFLRLTFPVDYWAGRFDELVAWVKRWTGSLPVFHGNAGFSFNQSAHRDKEQMDSRYVFPLAMRFHGVEVDDPSRTAESCYHDIKGVNWLTLVSEPLLDPLGGINMTQAALERERGVTAHRLPWGLLIQAGQEPGIGDVNAEDFPLPLYRHVNKVLRPIRTRTHFQLGDEMDGSFGELGTLRWLRRFDGGGA
jgi:hypothetical protein